MLGEQLPAWRKRHEVEFLLFNTRSDLTPEEIVNVRSFVKRDVDWDALYNMAQFHGIAGLVYRSLKGCSSENAPHHVMERFRAGYQAALGRARLMAGELARVLKLMEKHDIRVIPFKGPALAIALYGVLGTREFGDLDILIRRQDLPAAKKILLQAGYRFRDPMNTVVRELLERYDKGFTFVKEDLNLSLDLQWGIAESRFAFHYSVDDMLGRCRRLSFGDGHVLGLSAEDLMILLSFHGSHHAWTRLKWVCDLAQLILRHPDLDWMSTLNRARELGCLRRVLLGLSLARDLLAANVPEPVAIAERADPKIRHLADDIKDRLYQGACQDLSGLALRKFESRLVEGIASKARYVLGLSFSVNESDLKFVTLPKCLFSLYYLLRPVRLLATYGNNLARKAGGSENKTA